MGRGLWHCIYSRYLSYLASDGVSFNVKSTEMEKETVYCIVQYEYPERRQIDNLNKSTASSLDEMADERQWERSQLAL